MRIIITGATGSLGAYMVRHFASRGHDILASGRIKNPPSALLKIASYHQADITEPFSLPEADAIIHTAALSDDKGKEKALYDANVTGTAHVVKAASKVPVFIHISSSSVYLPENFPIREELAGKQNNRKLSPYGYSKWLSENKLKEVLTQESCSILRPRALYGPGDKVIMPRMLKLVKGDHLNRPGPMNIQVSLTHYRNLAQAIERCLASSHNGIRTYNVADGEVYRLIDIMVQLTTELYGHHLQIKPIPISLMKLLALFRIGGVTPLLVRAFTKSMVLDINRIRDELDYQPVDTYSSSLGELGAWVRSVGGVSAVLTGEKSLAWEGTVNSQ